MKFGKSILRGIALAAAVCILGVMLGVYVRGTGSEAAGAESGVSAAIGSRFEDYVNNAKASALDGIVPIKKVYRLDRMNPVAPEPRQECFGETDDPEAVLELLDKAAGLLDGQETQWSPETELLPGSKLEYYYDETILVLTWKEVVNRAVYTFSEVKIADASQFRRYLCDNVFGSSIQCATSDMAATVNAVAAMNGDFYKFRSLGLVVYESQVRRVAGELVDSCCVDKNGDIHFVYRGEILDQATAEQYVADNDILFSVAFGPVMLDGGENVTPADYVQGEINDIYARAAFCQLDALHYLMVTVNTEKPNYTNAATVNDVALELQRRGVEYAYTLDGGQTATIVLNDRVINSVEFGAQRNISDILYFATALPDK